MPSLDRNQVIQFIGTCIADIKDGAMPEETALQDLNLIEDLGFDSLDFINILFRVEEVYEITIPEPDIDEKGLFEVGKLADYVCAAGS